MAKSKQQLKLVFLEQGGDAALIPENLDEITADKLEEMIEALKLQKQLSASGNAAGAAATADPSQPSADAPKTQETPAAAPAGIKFVLTKASRYGSARLPDKNYDAGVPYHITDEAEAKVLRASGLFTEGDQ